MRERAQVLVGPIPVTAPWSPPNLASLVTADVLARRAAAGGRPLAVVTALLSAGLCDEYGTEDDLRREGLDKAMLGRPAFVARAQELEQRARARLAAVAGRLGVAVDLEAGGAAAEAGLAAATAFVRLFDAGLVVEAERVVDVCPRCATVVAGPDAVPAGIESEALVVRLLLDRSTEAALDVRCLAPELLPGVVAVALPEGHAAAGAMAAIPVAATVVPVVAEPSLEEPALLVPGHDAGHLAVARRLGLGTVPVVDARGVVCAAGPLDGLARYGARTAARRILAAEGALVGAQPASEPAARCAACHTVLVPVVGTHWFLALGDLELAAADAVRDGRLTVSPPSARDELLVRAAMSPEWCLSGQLWTGQPLPVARCADCGHVDVSVDTASSCGRCMGRLEPEDGVLDAHFVRCVWPLAVAGWPDAGRAPGETAAGSLLVLPPASTADVLPMVALGLRLSGDVPFTEVVVLPGDAGEPGGVPLDVESGSASVSPRALRVALVGGLGLDEAQALVDRIDALPAGGADVDGLDESCAAAFDTAAPASALGLVRDAVAEGVPPRAASQVRALAAPFLGE